MKKILSIALLLVLVTTTAFAGGGFKDVKPNQWFYQYVMRASELGIIDGYADGTFRPNEVVTRAQLSKIMVQHDNQMTARVIKMTTDERKIINAVAKSVPSSVKVIASGDIGSGFFVKNNVVMTNYHVVGGLVNPDILTVSGEILDGEVIASDKALDIALIRVKGDYKPLQFASSLELGQTAIAIGHPHGLPNSVTRGIVSRLNVNDVKDSNMFQLDSAVNPGNSGGAVVNSDGKVIGMVTAKFMSGDIPVEGVAVAITYEELVKFLNDKVK